MIDEPLAICPECGGSIRRVLYPAGIVFKGSGFYKTDHNASSTPGSNGHAPKSENGSAAATSETGTSAESKPASKESNSSSAKSESKAAAPTTS